MIKREEYLNRIRPFIDKDVIKVLTGIRRSGKSVMLQLIGEELIEKGIKESQLLFINFETKSLEYVKDTELLYAEIKKMAEKNKNKKIYLFLDEVQELEGWEKVVNSCMIDFDVDIYVTGSNAKMLSSELATYLAGRYVEIKVYPFSFEEVLEVSEEKNEKELFNHYIQWGGMPFLYENNLDENSTRQYLEDIYSSVILKDIIQRNNVRDVELFKRIIMYIISNVGRVFSSTSISKYLKSEKRKASLETIYNYIDYSKSACLFYTVPREDLIGKKLLKFQEKIYITDHGLREVIYGNNNRDIDQILENIVFVELLRRGYEVNVGVLNKKEIDFVAKKGNEKIYIQVSYLLASDDTMEREFSSLEEIKDNYKKYVVTMDEIDRSRNGIQHINIIDFLLIKEWN